MNAVSATNIATAKVSRWRMLLPFPLYFVVTGWLAWLIYNLSGEGIAFLAGKALVAFLIPGLIAVLIAWKSSRPATVMFVGIALSAANLIHMNWDEMLVAYDAREFHAEIANANPEGYLGIVNASRTRTGRVLSSSIRIQQQSHEQIDALLADLDDAQFQDMLAPATLKSRDKMLQLASLARQKRQNAVAADARVDAIYEAASQQFRPVVAEMKAATLQRAFLRGYQESSNQMKSWLKECADNYMEIYDNLITIYGILDQQAGGYSVTGTASVVFTNSKAGEDFNSHLAALVQASKNVVEIRQRIDDAQKLAMARMLHPFDQ
jgi:hypothetical protein